MLVRTARYIDQHWTVDALLNILVVVFVAIGAIGGIMKTVPLHLAILSETIAASISFL